MSINNLERLFKPDSKESVSYVNSISRLYLVATGKLNTDSTTEQLKQRYTYLGKVPYVLRALGMNAGRIWLPFGAIAHIAKGGKREFFAESQNEHDLDLKELQILPQILADPDIIFRSNSIPNNALLVCASDIKRRFGTEKERDNPIQIALNMVNNSEIIINMNIRSVYEKNTNTDLFYSDLIKYDFCLYNGYSLFIVGDRRKTR